MADVKKTTSKFLSLNLEDLGKGLLVAVITPVFTIISQSLEAGSLTFDWKAIGITALAAALAYLTKNFLQPSQTIIKIQPPAEKTAGAE